MLEYVVLGVFAVVVTAVAILALGKMYTADLTLMVATAAGETYWVETQAPKIHQEAMDEIVQAQKYFQVINAQVATGPKDWDAIKIHKDAVGAQY